MADVQPFRAFHYAPTYLKKIASLVCPPYDVISPEQRRALARRGAYNFVRVELPEGADAARYGRAARLWRDWLSRGVLVREEAPAFYAYEAAFRSEKDRRPLRRRGFFGALETVPWGRGVFPHEKTLPTAKADRLNLFNAMRAQTSPIQCLFKDPRGGARRLLARAARTKPWVAFRDEAGVGHRFWRIAAPEDVRLLRRSLADSPVSVADGHHRYETSRAYAAAHPGAGPAARRVMTYFSAVEDEGLEILPTHRSVGWDKRRFVQLEKWGALTPVAGLRSLAPLIRGGNGARAASVGVYREGRFYKYAFSQVPAALRNTPQAGLAVARLHAGALHGLGKEDFFFTRRPELAVERADASNGWAFFLGPNTVREVLEVSSAGHVMPPKSTYFYPKIPSGILVHALEGGL